MEEEQCCSFCKRPRRQVRHLVAGKNAFICDVCAKICKQLADSNNNEVIDFPAGIKKMLEPEPPEVA